MPKGGKSSGDYEGWLLRLLDKPENLYYAFDEETWMEFAEQKMQDYFGQGLTGGQLGAIEDLRERALALQKDIGISAEVMPSLRGAGGQRIRDMAGEYGRKGAWVSAAKVQAKITGEIDARVAEAKRTLREMRRGYEF